MEDVIAAARFTFETELNSLFPALDIANRTIEHFQSELQSLPQSQSNAFTTALTNIHLLKDNLETVITQRRAIFVDQLTDLQKQSALISTLVDESELLLTAEEFSSFEKLQSFERRMADSVEELNRFELPEPPPQLCNGVIPPFERITIVVPHFLSEVERVRSGAEKCVYRDGLKAFGGIWRAQVFPSGRLDQFREYVAVFLEMLRGPKEKMKYVVRFVVFNQRNREWNCVRECGREFCVGDSWGWDDAVEIGKLAADRRVFGVEEEELKMALEVRPVSYKAMYERVTAAYERLKVRGEPRGSD
jgi:hypothetical protein